MTDSEKSMQNECDELDQAAYAAAAAARLIVEIRQQIAILATLSLKEIQRDEAELLKRLTDAEVALSQPLQKVLAASSTVAKRIALGKKADDHSADEFAAVAKAKVWGAIHKFNRLDDSPVSGSAMAPPTSSKFRAWLSTTLSRYYIDYIRNNKKWKTLLPFDDQGRVNEPDIELEADERVPLRALLTQDSSNGLEVSAESVQQVDANARNSVREIPAHFSSNEEEALSQLSDLCVHLFLFSTGLWGRLSDGCKQRWGTAEASDWELSSFSSLGRANRFLLNQAELELQNAIGQRHPATFEKIHARLAQVYAQNLNRSFWKFLKLDTAWQYIFRNVVPFSDAFESSLLDTQGSNDVAVYLLCDCEMAFSSASRCFAWLEAHDFKNTATRNLGKIIGQKFLEGGETGATTSRINHYKCQLVSDFTCVLIDEKGAESLVQNFFDDSNVTRSREIPLRIAAVRHLVDLPLAFERINSSSLRRAEGHSFANDD